MNTEAPKNNYADCTNQKKRALRIASVIDKTGLSRTQIYRLVKSKAFPAPVKLSTAISAWDESLIDAWLEDRFHGGQS